MPFWVRNYEERREKRITTVGTHVFYMKAGSQFLEHGPPVQHPKRERWPSKSLPPQPPPLILKPKPPGYEILLGWWKKEQLRGLKTLSSFYLACGRRILPWFSPKEEEADQAVSSEKQPWPRRQLVHAAGELTEQSIPRGPGREKWKKGKDSPQLFTTAWGQKQVEPRSEGERRWVFDGQIWTPAPR